LTDEGVKLRSDAQDEFDLIFNLLSRIMYLWIWKICLRSDLQWKCV
jgi:hypothetical protein